MRAGEIMCLPEYGRTLEQPAGGGPNEFYQGGIARAMADDFTAHGAFVTSEDLSG